MQRVHGLDVARSWAMLLALLAHALEKTGVGLPTWAGLVFRTSTPLFILLFGLMIALVHQPRWQRLSRADFSQSAVSRAVQCYALFLLNVISLSLAEAYGWKFMLLCAAMLGSTPYAAILKYYVVLFVSLPIMMVILNRFRLRTVFLCACAVHLIYPLLKAIPVPPPVMGQPILERIVSFLFGSGISNELAGPSVIHSLVLVVSGYWFGLWINQARHNELDTSRLKLWPLFAAFAGLGTLSLMFSNPEPVTLDGLASMRLRNLNHPSYIFIIGGAALAIILLFIRAFENVKTPGWLLLLGRRSLFAFGFGNVLVAFWPRPLAELIGPSLSAALLLLFIIFIVAAYDYLMKVRSDSGLISRLAEAVQGISRASQLVSSRLAAWLLALGPRTKLYRRAER